MVKLSINDKDIYSALAKFLAAIVPQGTGIQRGQQNRVAEPTGPCVIITTLGALDRIGTNADETLSNRFLVDSDVDADSSITADADGFTTASTADFEYSVQADFYSEDAESWAMAVELIWRSKSGWYSMPSGMKPLYSDGRQQLPLVGSENQWIQRWTLTLVLDYQPTLMLPTQAALTAEVIPEPIDVFYPNPEPPPPPPIESGFVFGVSEFGEGRF